MFLSGKSSRRIAIVGGLVACATSPVLPAQAETSAGDSTSPPSQSGSPRLGRSAPANFRDNETQEVIGLWWNGEAVPGALFLAGKSSSTSTDAVFKPVPGTAPVLKQLLIDIGIRDNYAQAWSSRTIFSQPVTPCLQLAAATGCVELQLIRETHEGKKYLALKTDEALAARYGQVKGFSLIGNSQFSVGTTYTRLYEGRYLSASTRGIATRGRMSYEYDLGYSNAYNASKAADSSTNSLTLSTASYRLLVAGLGLENGGRVYAGTFVSAFGNFSADGSSQFFSHPALVGLAYRSRGARLSNFGIFRKIRLILQTESQIRITSGGIELFNAMVAAGDQMIEFRGYPEPFVDVSIRNSTGLTRTERVEVLAPSGTNSIGDGLESTDNTSDNLTDSEFYMDTGRLVDISNVQSTDFKIGSASQASFYYTRWIGAYGIGAGAQAIGDRRRISTTLTGPLNRWRINAMVGIGGERGLGANLSSLEYGNVSVSLNATHYRPPSDNALGAVSFIRAALQNDACQAGGNSLCFQNTRYDSFGFNVGYRNFPIRFGYLAFNTPVAKYASVNLTGIYSSQLFSHPVLLVGYLSHDLNSKSTSLVVSFSIPLDNRQTLVTSLTGVNNGSRGLSTSYTRVADTQSEDYIRSINLGASTSSPDGDTNTSAYITSQLGAFNNSVGINTFGANGFGIASTISVGYAANGSDLALSNTGYASVPTGLANSQGSAVLALVNESFDSQTFKVGDAVYVINPRSSRLIERDPGELGKWSIAPGPAQDLQRSPKRIGRGEVALFKILGGFWAQATFRSRQPTEAIVARFTYKAVGGELTRLYPDSRFRTLLYETLDSGSDITRFIIDNNQKLWQCSASAPGSDSVERNTYTMLSYLCNEQK